LGRNTSKGKGAVKIKTVNNRQKTDKERDYHKTGRMVIKWKKKSVVGKNYPFRSLRRRELSRGEKKSPRR